MDTKGINNQSSINTGITSKKVADPSLIREMEKVENGGGKQADFNVSLSDRAQEIMQARNKAMAIAKDTSPIREDRVAEFRERIKNGTYTVDSGNIADGMLREAIKDELAKSTEA